MIYVKVLPERIRTSIEDALWGRGLGSDEVEWCMDNTLDDVWCHLIDSDIDIVGGIHYTNKPFTDPTEHIWFESALTTVNDIEYLYMYEPEFLRDIGVHTNTLYTFDSPRSCVWWLGEAEAHDLYRFKVIDAYCLEKSYVLTYQEERSWKK